MPRIRIFLQLSCFLNRYILAVSEATAIKYLIEQAAKRLPALLRDPEAVRLWAQIIHDIF